MKKKKGLLYNFELYGVVLKMSRRLLSLWKFSFFELKFKTWDCKLYISYIRCLAFHLFNIWYSIFMFNFQFWFPFLKLSGVGTWRDVSDQKRQEVAKTTAGATKGFRDPFVQFFHHREFIFFRKFMVKMTSGPQTVSQLLVQRATLSDSGTYTCQVKKIAMLQFSKKNSKKNDLT